jgi:hypothetical protein
MLLLRRAGFVRFKLVSTQNPKSLQPFTLECIPNVKQVKSFSCYSEPVMLFDIFNVKIYQNGV